MTTHYETLGVSATASYEKIRHGYHDAARRWHPDQFAEAGAVEAEAAEAAMRQANEAWRVLSDEERRRSYDRTLRGGASGLGQGLGRDEGIRIDDGVTRVDPRLLDPRVLDRHRQEQLDEISVGQSRVLRVVPILGFVALLAGIFVFTAYAGRGTGEDPASVTVPGPDVGIRANACVRIYEGPVVEEASCASIHDGRLIGVLAADSGAECPALTVRTVELFNEQTLCLGR